MNDNGASLKNHITTLTYAVMIGDLQKIALNHGYALAFHGSMQRDFDIIAVPWTEDASSDYDLVCDIKKAIGDPLAGFGAFEQKPHGRRAFFIPMSCGLGIDISVMPTTRQ